MSLSKGAAGGGIDRSFPEIARNAIDELSNLISAQGRLLRLEFLSDVRQVGKRLAGVAIFAPLVLVGYVFLLLGAADLLREVMGLAGALFLIGGVHVLGAGIGLLRATKTLAAVQPLERSREEMKTTVEAVTTSGTEVSARPATTQPLIGSSHA